MGRTLVVNVGPRFVSFERNEEELESAPMRAIAVSCSLC